MTLKSKKYSRNCLLGFKLFIIYYYNLQGKLKTEIFLKFLIFYDLSC